MIFNENDLLKYTENDSSLASELLQMAIQDIPEFLEKTCEKRNQEQIQESAEYLHKIKGIAGCIGAVSIHRVAAEIEQEIKLNGNGSYFDEHFPELQVSVNEFFKHPAVIKYSG